MLSLFKNKNKPSFRLNKAQEELAHKIVNACLRFQRKIAEWLQMKSERLSPKSKLILFALFICLFSTYSLYLIVDGGTDLTLISINPAEPYNQVNQLKEDRTLVSIGQYKSIQKFKTYMDSLARSPTGRKQYEYILITRPGLMDSINLIDSLFKH